MVVNDDGAKSKHVNKLCYFLKKQDHNVFAVLPQENQSGMSGRIDINGNLHFHVAGKYIILSGSPIDCIHFGIQYLEKRNIEIDLVISGVNIGLNYGTATFYSGTVAAALEANLYGINSIAISVDDESVTAKNGFLMLIEKIIEFVHITKLKGVTLNLNFARITDFSDIFQIIFENEFFDKSFILPKLVIEKESFGLKANGSVDGTKIGANTLMYGILSRYYGLYIEDNYYIWAEEFENFLNQVYK